MTLSAWEQNPPETFVPRLKATPQFSATILKSISGLESLWLCRSGGENSEKLAAARILAKDVLDSFTAMREYLREDRLASVGAFQIF